MAGASIETTLELWASLLRDVKARIRPLFRQERVQYRLRKFLDGLLGNEPRRQAGCARKRRAIPARGVSRLSWAASGMPIRCAISYASTRWKRCDETAVLVIDETGFLKQGKASCGFPPIHGLGGQDHQLPDRRVCFLLSRHGHAFIDRGLYLPKEWTTIPTA